MTDLPVSVTSLVLPNELVELLSEGIKLESRVTSREMTRTNRVGAGEENDHRRI